MPCVPSHVARRWVPLASAKKAPIFNRPIQTFANPDEFFTVPQSQAAVQPRAAGI